MRFKLGSKEVSYVALAESLNDADILKTLKKFYLENKTFIEEKFEKGELNGIETGKELSLLCDVLFKALFSYLKLPDDLAIMAVGGYGREELAPYSDVDLWFLTEQKASEKSIKQALYILWDIGLKIGYSVANVYETIELVKTDITVFTTLLDARFLFGNNAEFLLFEKAFKKIIAEDKDFSFLTQKDEERKERHKNMGHSRYLLEPNLKEGCGGLRDLQFILWLSKYVYGDSNIFSVKETKRILRVKNFLFTARCALHFSAKRANEILSMEYQKNVAKLMGYKAHPGTSAEERLMKHFYLITREMRELTAIFLSRFDKTDEDLSFNSLPELLNFLWQKQKKGEECSPNAFKQIALWSKKSVKFMKNPEVIACLKKIICADESPEYVLRILNESNILSRILPEFRAINARPQVDIYHIYTVDEHTLKALGFLCRLKNDSKLDFICSAKQKIKKWNVLSMAIFLHDIGKNGFMGHAEKGALTTLNICKVFGFTADETDLIVWLVRNHLLMSKTAFQRDLSDVKTINDFSLQVGSEEKLAMLLLLTVADIMAVASNVWNDWKADLLKELYNKSIANMSGINIVKDESLEPILLKMKAKTAMTGLDVAVDISFMPEVCANKIVIYSKDKMGLFAKIAGALAISRASVISARLATTEGFALDTFIVQEALNVFKPEQKQKEFSDVEALAKLEQNLYLALTDKINMKQKMLQQIKKSPSCISGSNVDTELNRRVIIDNNASLIHTLIEINSLDRMGFLFLIASKFAELSVNVVSAHICTYGKRIVDAFYVCEPNGTKITDQKRLEEVQKELYNTLDFNFKEAF